MAVAISITLTTRSSTVKMTAKGQVTIPQEIRNRLGLLPHTQVEFELVGDHAAFLGNFFEAPQTRG
jgi:AbrB family looped-hinge helix DNA binding protein